MRLRRLLRVVLKSSVARGLALLLLVAYFFVNLAADADPSKQALGGNELVQEEVELPTSFILSPQRLAPLHANDSSSLLPHRPSGINTDWREVVGSKRALFVYSAYLDKRKPKQPYVRLVAIVKRKTKYIECSYWSATSQQSTLTGKVRIIRENWNLLYSAAFILCPVPDFNGSQQPVARVSVSTSQGSSNNYQASMPVQDLASRSQLGEMSVCIKPLHYEFNRAVWLVEFIEMYRLLGADRFIFYNHTVGPDVDVVLQHYAGEGVVEILPWSLPVETKTEIRTEGIFASLNDCNLRSVGHFPLTAMVDIDEFIIPRTHGSLLDLVQEIGHYNTYVFKNVFFYLYWENDTALYDALSNPIDKGAQLFGGKGDVPYLLTQTKTRRLNKAHGYGIRSKYLARPEAVVEIGNHVVWEYTAAKSIANVPESKGLSQHYRICEFGGFECLKDANSIDRTAHRYLMPLVKAVSSACQHIFPDQPACPPAPPLGSPW